MIIQGDCLEVMKTFPDKSFDLLLTDPPYGIGIDGQKESFAKNPKHNRKFHKKTSWDNEIPSQDYFIEMFRVSRNQIIWGGNYFVEYLKPSKGWIVWDKGQKNLTMSDGELAYTSFDFPLRIFVCNRVALLKDFTQHPTQKPVSLMKYCLDKFSKEGDKILDCFMGSGTTGVACALMNREFTGIELDAGYCEIAEKRIAIAKSQGKLFNYNLET